MSTTAAIRPPLLSARPLAAVVLAALCAGCHNLPDRPGANAEQLLRGTLESTRPIDVAVAPVVNRSGSEGVPLADLRQAFHAGLVKRRYSPLALEYVDRHVVEASYAPGAVDEDAVLRVEVTVWDASRWKSHGVLAVEIEAWMLDARDGGNPLWGGRLTRKLSLAQDRKGYATEAMHLREISADLAQELLEVLPARAARP